METKTIQLVSVEAKEVISQDILIRNPQDALDLLGNVQSKNIVLHEHNFEKEFFDLSTRTAGEILQKMTNYFVKIAIIGDFEKYQSESLKAFIYESNKHRNHIFVNSMEEVEKLWHDLP